MLSADTSKWSDWRKEAIGYLDKVEYPEGLGPNHGFCQYGICDSCKTEIKSNVKHAICPVCLEKVYCT